jgi:transcriptional regulator GlxA family with amidase domain
MRTDRIAQLLVETDLPVARIADLLGFTDPQHVARYFRTAKRLSPTAYRQAYGGKEWRAQNGDLFAQNGVLS